MDKAIEEEQGKSISDIFSQDGEEAFRNMETCFLKRLSEEKTDKPRVVSCGGGAALREENVRLMKETGIIIYLTATPQTIYERARSSNTRPLLSGNMTVAYISTLMQKRTQAYEHAASHQVSTDEKTAEDICREILTLPRETDR